MKSIFDQLRLKQLEDLDEDPYGENRISQHTEIRDSKRAFKMLVTDIHWELLGLFEKYDTSGQLRPICEIGAGVIPLSTLSERVISSDLVHNPNIEEWPAGFVFWVAPLRGESLMRMIRPDNTIKVAKNSIFRLLPKIVAVFPTRKGKLGTFIDAVKGVLGQNMGPVKQSLITQIDIDVSDWKTKLFL